MYFSNAIYVILWSIKLMEGNIFYLSRRYNNWFSIDEQNGSNSWKLISVRIHVRIVLLICRQRWLNGPVLRIRPQKKTVTPCHSSYEMLKKNHHAQRSKAPRIDVILSALHRWWWDFHISKKKYLDRDVKQYTLNFESGYFRGYRI